ncbi:MAG: hypothetical protein ACX98W_09155 [bacterium]
MAGVPAGGERWGRRARGEQTLRKPRENDHPSDVDRARTARPYAAARLKAVRDQRCGPAPPLPQRVAPPIQPGRDFGRALAEYGALLDGVAR